VIIFFFCLSSQTVLVTNMEVGASTIK
jgi:hypothetical protein